jgi:hypothetical protein
MKRKKELPDIPDKEIKKVKSILTQEDINEIFEYKDGDLYWKIDIYSGKNYKRCNVKIGDKVGCIDKKGYKVFNYDGKQYKISRVIFLIHNGYLPEKIVYKDSNILNTRIENLLEANSSQIFYRKNEYLHNKTGYRGVSFNNKKNKYRVYFRKNNKRVYLGVYNTTEEANKVYKIAREKYFGEFLNKCTNNRS